MLRHRFVLLLLPLAIHAADLPPDPTETIPESAKRPVVVDLQKTDFRAPKHTLPEGFVLKNAAAAPLVTHPIMGCVDDRGRLFVGDAVGVNWKKAQLEANPPNRILMLEDTDSDGVYNRSTVFADKLTFPQGACWHAGSLYVASPPGIWKLTDKDNDGLADVREMIVGGFDYTGNAADVHGPKLHPNGRLYWCHGRKGHKVTQKDGTLVHEGMASGIWSCLPDGTDVQWHSLGCADNPTGLGITPEGDLIGTCNLYYNSPRGDTLMHWLYGGVYERADQMQAIAGLPRTLEQMPVVHNFGHVAVSGCSFWSSQPGSPLYVTHFNTQRLVRMDLAKQGASFRATESEFLKIHDPDVHLTDVVEDRDGSLLVIDTGGWFRIGCPSGLMAKPDVLGAIYRISPNKPFRPVPAATKSHTIQASLQSTDPHEQRRALQHIAQNASALNQGDDKAALLQMMHEPLDAALEHALLLAVQRHTLIGLEHLQKESNPTALRRMLACFVPNDAAAMNFSKEVASKHLDSKDPDLARVAIGVVIRHQDAAAGVVPNLQAWLDGKISAERLSALERICGALITTRETHELIGLMLSNPHLETRRAALSVIAGHSLKATPEGWIKPIQSMLDQPQQTGLPLLLDAIKRLPGHPFDQGLQLVADDANAALPVRLKALDAMKKFELTGSTLTMVRDTVANASASPAARIQAASMLAAAPLDPAQQLNLAPLFAVAGPVELEKLLPLISKAKQVDIVRSHAEALSQNPSIASQQESAYRTAFSNHPPQIFETIVLPALNRASEAHEIKKRTLPSLAEQASRRGRISEGKAVYESGKGTCIACHRIGSLGRAIGPDLSKIGAIRTERDLLESILFPSSTLSRDHETHLIETSDGQSILGIIKSHTAEGLLVMDVAGQERSVSHAAIISNTQLPTSLMPMGLDQTMTQQDLLNLVVWLRSLQ